MPTPSFPGPPVVPIVGGKANWNGRTIQECSDAIRWLSEATGGVLLMAQAAPDGGVSQEDFDALVARVAANEAEITHVHEAVDALENRVAALEGSTGTMQTQVTQIDTDLDTVSADLDALDARVVVLETPPAP